MFATSSVGDAASTQARMTLGTFAARMRPRKASMPSLNSHATITMIHESAISWAAKGRSIQPGAGAIHSTGRVSHGTEIPYPRFPNHRRLQQQSCRSHLEPGQHRLYSGGAGEFRRWVQ